MDSKAMSLVSAVSRSHLWTTSLRLLRQTVQSDFGIRLQGLNNSNFTAMSTLRVLPFHPMAGSLLVRSGLSN